MADKYVKLDDVIDTLEHEWGYEGMREDLYNLPTADVVEVVRCKDCKYNSFEEANGTVHCCIDEFVRDRRKPEDFCSRGERRNKE